MCSSYICVCVLLCLKFKFPVPVAQKSTKLSIILRDKMIFTTRRENCEQMISFGNFNNFNRYLYIYTIHRLPSSQTTQVQCINNIIQMMYEPRPRQLFADRLSRSASREMCMGCECCDTIYNYYRQYVPMKLIRDLKLQPVNCSTL